MADFLSSLPAMSSSTTTELSPNSSPGASLFQDSTKFLQQLGFLETFSGTPTTIGGFSNDGPTSSTSNISALARNSTKTLKCPKCNWHYKYQEALENHLKDKHPDVEVTCIYCIQNLQHPKLARGETYSCGYKPFRCTICNYSTTTKGNLSIHMQSDKHLHAMQDIPTTIVTTSQSGAPQSEQSDDKIYHCLVCGTFTTDSIEDLISHLNSDRSQTNTSDISSLHGIYQCYLCPYTTNLKANFQLHMRTDKHIQRVQMINHMRENVLASTSPTSNLLCRLSNAKTGTQVRCRPCFEILTSIESIREHCQTSGHLTRTNFMQNNTAAVGAAAVLGFPSDESEAAMDLSMESNTGEESNYQCLKCDFQTLEEQSAIDHLQDHDLLNSDCLNAELSLIDQIPEEREELAQLLEMNDARLKCDKCPDCITASIEDFQSHLNNHSVNTEKSSQPEETKIPSDNSQTIEVKCPLCDMPKEMSSLHSHLLDDHKISSDVAKKLMATNGISNEKDSTAAPSTSPIYKYHCKLCPMIFRTNDGFQMHSLKHIFTSTHKCTRCNRSFKTIQSLRNHMTNKHEISNFDSTNDNSCSICSETFRDRQALQTHIYSIEHLHKAKSFLEQQSTGKLGQQLNEQVLSLLSKIPKNGGTSDSQTAATKKPYKCNVCRLSYGQGSTLDIHLRSVAHQTRIGRLSELVASGEVDASLPVSEQPGGIAQKSIGELVLPSTTSELEKLQRSESPMDVASTTASTATPSSSRKRKINDDSAAANPFAAFQNIMNMSQLFGQFANENLENGSMDFNSALAALNSGDLQNFLTEHLTQQQPSSVHSSQASSPRASPIDEISDEPKTGKSLRHTLEADGLELIEQFFANLSSVKHNIDRIPDSEISELCKVDCPNCDTVFPSMWILKQHAKDLHAVSLPLEAVQQFSEKLKQALDDLEEENQIPETKKQKIEEITNNLKAGKLNGTSGNAKSSTKKSSQSKSEDNSSTSPSMDSSNIPNLAMMSMLAAGSNFPMLMNPFLSMMNPEMLTAASQANGSNNGTNGSMPTVSSPGCGGDFSALTGQQRRARTKITDDQLKVLKQYFDISNSPTEQQVKEMAMKTGLLEKVIKHWFRNTLFKERQRDKDSPYNFNVPPQLSIDLDTYEKTGEAKIKPFKSDDNDDASNVSTPAPSTPIQMPQLEIKKEPKISIKQEPKVILDPTSAVNSQTAAFVSAASEFMANLNKACNNNFNPFALLSQAAMGGGTPTSTDKSFSDMLASSTSLDLTSPLPSATPNGTGGNSSSGGGGGSGRRANRTRFTDLQLRSLQQFFDKQAYPKDDDLEMLSKKLNLSPRVIVVWFQNARQKARKIYENTPNLDNNERFVRTPGQNFQCKRCQLVFPRYYELIQHQQKVCYVNDNDAQQNDNKFVEEMMSDDEKPTTSYDNTSSATVNITTGDPLTLPSGSSHAPTSPLPSQSTMETLNQLLNGTSSDNGAEEDKEEDSARDIPLLPGTIASSEDLLKFLTGKCDNATLNKLLESSGKQQLEDFSNDMFQAPLDLSTSPTFLQEDPSSNNHSRRESSLNYLDTDFDFSTVMSSVSPTNFPSMLSNTFFSSNGSSGSPTQQRSPSATSMSNQQGGNKRYRTHLTPLQVYVMKALFNDYKTPSMTECDILGKEIGLNKRVVQVWFQNARAKERKCRSVTGDEDLPKTNNDSCGMCGIDFNTRTPKLTMQDHIFTKRHIGFLSERFNSRSTSQSSNPGRHDGSLSPPPQIVEPAPERVRARAVRDSGSRKPSSINARPSSTNSQFPFNLMYGLQSGTLPHLMCDPSILGTPIAALQIPQAVMQQIQIDIQAGKESTKFTQDGLELKDLKAKISDDDFKCVTTVTNEVGYACPGCSYTFQQQPQLEAHQKIICQNFEGKIFKLLQIHYECIACNTKTGTQDDFKKHIESHNHQQIRNLFIQPVIENFLTSSAM